jgi:hypothetical protein
MMIIEKHANRLPRTSKPSWSLLLVASDSPSQISIAEVVARHSAKASSAFLNAGRGLR